MYSDKINIIAKIFGYIIDTLDEIMLKLVTRRYTYCISLFLYEHTRVKCILRYSKIFAIFFLFLHEFVYIMIILGFKFIYSY